MKINDSNLACKFVTFEGFRAKRALKFNFYCVSITLVCRTTCKPVLASWISWKTLNWNTRSEPRWEMHRPSISEPVTSSNSSERLEPREWSVLIKLIISLIVDSIAKQMLMNHVRSLHLSRFPLSTQISWHSRCLIKTTPNKHLEVMSKFTAAEQYKSSYLKGKQPWKAKHLC